MVVRVKVRVRPLKGKSSGTIETSALANAGYESIAPEVVIPARLARRLGFLPKLPKDARKETYVSVMGTATMQFIPDALKVTVSTSDREAGPVTGGVLISKEEREVLLSDRMIEELKLLLYRPGAGLWKFTDDKPEVMRESTQAQEW